MRLLSQIGVSLVPAASLLCAVAVAARCGVASADESFRVGFTSNMFTEINENDAKAAVRGWGQTVAKQRNIPTDPETAIFNSVPTLLEALRVGKVDAVGITILDYAALHHSIHFDPVFATCVAQRNTDQYLLLTHRESGINSLEDLRGRSVGFQHYARACLAQPWLDTLLVEKGCRPIGEFAGKLTFNAKLSKTVLPVFFRQLDACVATRSGFGTMVELNPQLGKQLKVIATSPELAATVFCFRADYNPSFRESLLAGMRELHQSPVGQQVLMIFQTERIEQHPASFLDSTLELVAKYEKLTGSIPGTTNVPALPLAEKPAMPNPDTNPPVSR